LWLRFVSIRILVFMDTPYRDEALRALIRLLQNFR